MKKNITRIIIKATIILGATIATAVEGFPHLVSDECVPGFVSVNPRASHFVCGKQDEKDPFEYVSPVHSAHTVSVEPVPVCLIYCPGLHSECWTAKVQQSFFFSMQ